MAKKTNRLAMLVPPAGHRTLAEKAFAALHEAIVTGSLKPGERLPIEELAELLEMSPMPIREALRRLDSVGLVENVPHRGARVTQLSPEDLHQVYDVRLALEPLAVAKAAVRFTDEDAELAGERLARYNAALSADGDPRMLWSAHTAFHFALYEAANSAWLMRLITPPWESSERYRLASLPLQRSVTARRGEHERILDACTRRDPEGAMRELRDHLGRTANVLSRNMGAGDMFVIEEEAKASKRPAAKARKGAAAKPKAAALGARSVRGRGAISKTGS